MRDFNYIFLIIFSILMVSVCRGDDETTEDLVPIDLQLEEDICTMPIDEGNCETLSISNSNDDTIVYFGYNVATTTCEEFIYEGCGGNENRFESADECWKTCYTPLKYFLARVSDLLSYRYNNSGDWVVD